MAIYWPIASILFFIVPFSLCFAGEMLYWLPAREVRLVTHYEIASSATLNGKKASTSLLKTDLEWDIALLNGQKSSLPPLDFAITLKDFSYSLRDPLLSQIQEKPPAGFPTLLRLKGEKITVRYQPPYLGAPAALEWVRGAASFEKEAQQEILAFLETPLTLALLAAGIDLEIARPLEFDFTPKEGRHGFPSINQYYTLEPKTISPTKIEAIIGFELPQQKISDKKNYETIQGKGHGQIEWSVENPLLFKLTFEEELKNDSFQESDLYSSTSQIKIHAEATPLHGS